MMRETAASIAQRWKDSLPSVALSCPRRRSLKGGLEGSVAWLLFGVSPLIALAGLPLLELVVGLAYLAPQLVSHHVTLGEVDELDALDAAQYSGRLHQPRGLALGQ